MLLQVALRWCTSCDDPFCGDCWSLIHLRGKRVRHAYCEIDLKVRRHTSPPSLTRSGHSRGTHCREHSKGGCKVVSRHCVRGGPVTPRLLACLLWQGVVGTRAIGPQGEDAGTFKAGQQGQGGYASDYGE